MSSVLQGWVEELTLKKQTVLITAIRSPDDVHTLPIKQVVIWIRATVLRDADPMTGFMHKALSNGLPLFEHIDREFERLPLHAAHHIILALQVIGNDGPSLEVRLEAETFYRAAVDAQHLNPEQLSQYERRMTDNVDRVERGNS